MRYSVNPSKSIGGQYEFAAAFTFVRYNHFICSLRRAGFAGASAVGGGGADSEPNKCYSEWDFCSAGSEAENAYHWQLGWCVAAAERGAISVSVSACMGQEEGTVSYPRSSSSSSSSAVASDNKCYTEWDFCNAGSEAENAYFWKLGWCAVAVERGAMLGELGHCMRGEAPPTRAAPLPDETQDLPWSRAYCLLTYPGNPVITAIGNDYVCGWDATLPPGLKCRTRNKEYPWECTEYYVPSPTP